jgi:hypothetical protein
LVGLIQNLLLDPGPVFADKYRKILNGNPIYSGCTSIGLNLLPGVIKIDGLVKSNFDTEKGPIYC